MALSDYLPYFQTASQQYGVSYGYLAATAQYESGGNASLVNRGSGASGLFQFVPSTARDFGLSNPFDPQASTNAAAQYAAKNANYLTTRFGGYTDADLYLAHQQGAGGAAALIANPDAPAASLLGYNAVAGNLPSNLAGQAGSMTAAEFRAVQAGLFGQKAAQAGVSVTGVPGSTGSPSAGAPAAIAQTGGVVGTPVQPGAVDWIADYFLRFIVVVLGFIFVAVGLGMFRGPAVVQRIRNL